MTKDKKKEYLGIFILVIIVSSITRLSPLGEWISYVFGDSSFFRILISVIIGLIIYVPIYKLVNRFYK